MRGLTYRLTSLAAVSCIALAACTSGQSGVEPPVTQTDVQNGTVLQFAVGTARYANGTLYLNTLVTYRQPSGASAVLDSTPTIAGPAGFVVPAAASAGSDAGTAHISGTPPTQPGTPAVATTFGQSGGAFAYGFSPSNSTSSTVGGANYPQFAIGSAANNAIYADDASTIIAGTAPGNTALTIFGDPGAEAGAFAFTYTQPLYVRAPDRLPFVVGPPAVPLFNNGTFPAGFLGYPSGFTLFGATPVAGAYTLTVVVPGNSPSAGPVATKTATATLTSVAGLPAEPIPLGVASDGAGGVTVTVGPPPAGATHQVLYVVGVSASTGSPTFYTARADSAGTYAFSTAAVGPQNAQGQHQPLFGAGDSVYAYAVGADYDVLALGPPGNVSPSPALPAQADVTVSPVYEAAYGTAAGPLARRRTR